MDSTLCLYVSIAHHSSPSSAAAAPINRASILYSWGRQSNICTAAIPHEDSRAAVPLLLCFKFLSSMYLADHVQDNPLCLPGASRAGPVADEASA